MAPLRKRPDRKLFRPWVRLHSPLRRDPFDLPGNRGDHGALFLRMGMARTDADYAGHLMLGQRPDRIEAAALALGERHGRATQVMQAPVGICPSFQSGCVEKPCPLVHQCAPLLEIVRPSIGRFHFVGIGVRKRSFHNVAGELGLLRGPVAKG